MRQSWHRRYNEDAMSDRIPGNGMLAIARFLLIASVLAAALVAAFGLGCTTIPIHPIQGCEESVSAKNPTEFHFTMAALVTSVNIQAITNPAAYQIARSAVSAIIIVLEHDPETSPLSPTVTLAVLMGVDPAWGIVLSPLTGLFALNDPIVKCDRDAIVSYLRMISG